MKKISTNSVIITVGAIIRLIVSLISIPILIRLLGIEQYGIWTVINAQIGLLALAKLGISTALEYQLSTSYPQTNQERKFL